MLCFQKAPSSPGGAFALGFQLEGTICLSGQSVGPGYLPRCRRTAATEEPTFSIAAFNSVGETLSR